MEPASEPRSEDSADVPNIAASADSTAHDADTVEDPAPAATSSATSSREPGLVDLLVSVAGGGEKKKKSKRR